MAADPNTLRMLAAAAVEQALNGHPGAPLGSAEIAALHEALQWPHAPLRSTRNAVNSRELA